VVKRPGRTLAAFAEPKAYFPVCITQASLTGIGVLAVFLQKLGKTPRHQRSINLKLLEEAFAELGRAIPVLLLDEAQNYNTGALEEVRMLLGLNLPERPPALIRSAIYLLSACACVLIGLYSRIAARLHRGSALRARSLSRAPTPAGRIEPRLRPRRSISGQRHEGIPPPSIFLHAPPGSKRQRELSNQRRSLRARSNWFPAKCAKLFTSMTESGENWPQSVRELHELYCQWTGQLIAALRP
jgi:hypothetical protein